MQYTTKMRRLSKKAVWEALSKEYDPQIDEIKKLESYIEYLYAQLMKLEKEQLTVKMPNSFWNDIHVWKK